MLGDDIDGAEQRYALHQSHRAGCHVSIFGCDDKEFVCQPAQTIMGDLRYKNSRQAE